MTAGAVEDGVLQSPFQRRQGHERPLRVLDATGEGWSTARTAVLLDGSQGVRVCCTDR